MAPCLNWTKYINGIFYPYISIPANAYIIVKNPTYLSNVSRLIEDTDPRVVANFIGWRVILESNSILSDKWARMGRKLWIELDGRPSLRPKWSFCIGTVKKYFSIGSSSLYIGHLIENNQILLVREIVSYIVEAFMEIIRTNTWMDQTTMDEAINKTKLMKVHVGYPEQLLNQTAIIERYEFAHIKWSWSFFTNVMLMRRWQMDDRYMKIRFDNIKGQ